LDIFIDIDYIRKEFLIYVIDNSKKKVIPYRAECARDAIQGILEKHEKYNINQVYTYYYDNPLIYELGLNIKLHSSLINWYKNLEPSIRNRIYPVTYYYEYLKYDLISEIEYDKLNQSNTGVNTYE
jgi:hypothetical protein